MGDEGARYLREVQYRHPDKLAARALLHTRYGRRDWFEWLCAHIPLTSGSMVADVGCGAGAFWTNAPASVPGDLRLRLFDLSDGMVEAARRALAAGRWTDVMVEVADAQALPLAGSSADTVLAIHMLYHLPGPERGLAEMARVLRPSGTAAVVLNPAESSAELVQLMDRALGRAPSDRAVPLTSGQGLKLARQQFSDVQVVGYEDVLEVSDPIDLLAYVTSLPAGEAPEAAARLADAVQKAFAGSASMFRISKAVELLLCRRT